MEKIENLITLVYAKVIHIAGTFQYYATKFIAVFMNFDTTIKQQQKK